MGLLEGMGFIEEETDLVKTIIFYIITYNILCDEESWYIGYDGS